VLLAVVVGQPNRHNAHGAAGCDGEIQNVVGHRDADPVQGRDHFFRHGEELPLHPDFEVDHGNDRPELGCVRKNSFFAGALPTEMATMPAALSPFTPGRSRRIARNSCSSSSSCSSSTCGTPAGAAVMSSTAVAGVVASTAAAMGLVVLADMFKGPSSEGW